MSITLKAKIIPEPKPDTRTVFVASGKLLISNKPFITANGDRNILCGSCGRILLKNILEGQISNIVIKCPECNEYNEVM